MLDIVVSGPRDTPCKQAYQPEAKMFQLYGEGMNTGEIADSMPLSKHTIETRRKDIKRKIDMNNA